MTLNISKPYVIFLGADTDIRDVKTATGVVKWSPQDCLAEYALEGCEVTVGLPRVTTPEEARLMGAKTLVVGCGSPGGKLKPEWSETFLAFMKAGFDIACPMHERLADDPFLAAKAKSYKVRLIDFRYGLDSYPVGSGKKRRGFRLLTVGHDSNVGKKYTTMALHREARRVGLKTTFCATGQTGALIADPDDRYIINDSTRADFLSGAAEWLSPDADPDHWHLIEGQGSIWHPSFCGGALSLLMGSQPDVIILCIDPTREKMRRSQFEPVPVEQEIEANLMFARRTNIHAKMGGISLNMSGVHPSLYQQVLAQYSRYGFSVIDPNVPDTFGQLLSMMRGMSRAAS